MRVQGQVTGRGFTLIELIVSLVVATVVMGAAYRLLTGNQRFYRAQSQITDVQQNIRAVVLILPGELRELDATDGDINAMSQTSIDANVMRGFAVTCRATDPANGKIVVRNSLLYTYRAISPTRSGVLVYRDGDSLIATDDKWLTGTVTNVGSRNCDDGSAGTELTLNITGGNSQLDSVTIGSPVRVWERTQYRLFQDAGGWWLGVATFENGSWTATAPVVGPLRPNDGLGLTYLDAAGNVTASRTAVAMIQITVRGRSLQPINIPGRRVGPYEDSLTVTVGLRNN